ncbi:hypothetical protein [Streptomyces sp. NPDC058755]|uniref:hypothetical protein n=1 Tax=Streptomyces sp. NPDC058755 TaxID=3346624 RepID=UPI00369853DE
MLAAQSGDERGWSGVGQTFDREYLMSTTHETRQLDGVRNARYGEIILISPGERGELRAEVYNTMGLNDCPPEKWSALDAVSVAREAEVPAAWLNGPRFWLMDRITASGVGDIRSFQGLEARRVAELEIPTGLDLNSRGNERFYKDQVVNRDNEWLFAAGKPVYQLLDADGRTYVMQAYSHIVDDTLTTDALPRLADRLQLPDGWTYREDTPARDLSLRTVNGQAHVLQDELENTYMLLTQ